MKYFFVIAIIAIAAKLLTIGGGHYSPADSYANAVAAQHKYHEDSAKMAQERDSILSLMEK